MKSPPCRAVILTTTVVAAVSLASCGTSPSAGSSTTPATRTATGAAPSGTIEQEPPDSRAPIVDGTYRVRITANELTDAGGYDGSSAGTWTLTLADGRYQLHCARVEKDSEQCGDTAEPAGDSGIVVEVGKAMGDTSTLWLLYDQASTLAVNGCAPCNPTNKQLAPYYLEWSLEGQDLVFERLRAFSGFNKDLPDVNNFTLKPWKKIE